MNLDCTHRGAQGRNNRVAVLFPCANSSRKWKMMKMIKKQAHTHARTHICMIGEACAFSDRNRVVPLEDGCVSPPGEKPWEIIRLNQNYHSV